MRTIVALVGSICILGSLAPVGAAELKLCDDIKEDQSRMACLQEHIVHLEGDIVRLEGDISQLKVDLEQKLAATPTYKLQTTGQPQVTGQAQTSGQAQPTGQAKAAGPPMCLGAATESQPPVMVACDHPDAWKLIVANASPDVKNKNQANKNTSASGGDSNAKPAPPAQTAPVTQSSSAAKTIPK
jgi:hypothetical protein